MGKKSSSTTKPSKFAMPYITNAANTVQNTVANNQGNLQDISNSLKSGVTNLEGMAFHPDPTITAGQNYAQDVLGGKYLSGNPHLQGMIDQTNQDVTNQVNSVFGSAGRTGSGAHEYGLGRALAEADNNLRFNDYTYERNAMGGAASAAPSLFAGQFAGAAPVTALAQGAAQTPYIGANYLAQDQSGLLGNYNKTTQTQGLGTALGGLLGAGLSGWASGGFKLGGGGGGNFGVGTWI